MKSVGEAMAIGRTFKEALQKVIRSMEVKRFGLGLDRNDKWLAAMRAVEHEQLVLDVVGNTKAGRGKEEREGVGSESRPTQTGLRTADGQPIEWPIPQDKLSRKLAVPSQGRLYYIRYALKMGWSVEKVHALTNIDPFFLDQIKQLVEFEDTLCDYKRLEDMPREVLFEAKQLGYSDAQLANLYHGAITTDNILKVRAHRKALAIEPVYKLVDTCAAEFEAVTPYYYSTYEVPSAKVPSTKVPKSQSASNSGTPALRHSGTPADEVRITPTPKVIIIGGGPNRIGQGIEFDYCCVHAAFAAKELGFEAVMINSNPETVSTDYDTSDLLFFEPLTLEDTLNVVERLSGIPLTPSPRHSVTPSLVSGIIVQFGGQTPLNLAKGLLAAGAPIIGTSVDSIDRAEDRNRFDEVLDALKLKRPAAGIARSLDEAVREASRIGYPVLIRPSYVLGGRGMEICQDEAALRSFIGTALKQAGLDDAPVLIDKFLAGAVEVDVDVVADYSPDVGQATRLPPDRLPPDRLPQDRRAPSDQPDSGGRRDVSPTSSSVIAGILEQIEQAGIHSGDSACTLPPASLSQEIITRIETLAKDMARELRVNGLMNLQLAVKDNEIYVIEVNPRASRTVPFVGKATHTPWPAIAAKVMMGQSLADLVPDPARWNIANAPRYYAVKESVFPFGKFPGVDVVLGPEMRSTGEVMGIDASLPIAFAKSQMAAGSPLPTDPSSGGVFISVREQDRATIVEPVRSLLQEGFEVWATEGTSGFLDRHGVKVNVLQKIAAGMRPNVLDLMQNKQIALIINTPTRTGWKTDEGRIRATAVRLNIPMITTATAAVAAARAIAALRRGAWGVRAMQDYAESDASSSGGAVLLEPRDAPGAPARL
jgi:carbamoyl-phosphate synthase large subunit